LRNLGSTPNQCRDSVTRHFRRRVRCIELSRDDAAIDVFVDDPRFVVPEDENRKDAKRHLRDSPPKGNRDPSPADLEAECSQRERHHQHVSLREHTCLRETVRLLVKDDPAIRRDQDELESDYEGELEPLENGAVVLRRVDRAGVLQDDNDCGNEGCGEGELTETSTREIDEGDAAADG